MEEIISKISSKFVKDKKKTCKRHKLNKFKKLGKPEQDKPLNSMSITTNVQSYRPETI